MTLYEKYNEILQKAQAWEYYKNSPDYKAVVKEYESKTFDYFFENDNAYCFIQEYFKTGGKSMTLEQITQMHNNAIPDCDKEFKKRFIHTLSAFFLGLSIALSLWGKNECNFIVNNEKYDFIYVWFLTCLYHDVGYVFELDKKLQNRIHRIKERFDCYQMLKELDLDLGGKMKEDTIFRDLVNESKKNSLIEFRMQDIVIKANIDFYSDAIINKYGNYRAAEFGVLDHGLVGGMLLFYNLINMYLSVYKNDFNKTFLSSDQEITSTFIDSSELRFSPSHLILWNFISHCIVSHNIWKCPKDKKPIYNYFGLNSLIDHKFKRISFIDNPLLFLLSLVDTLEPIKGFDCTPKQLESIKNIRFCACKNEKEKYHLCFEYPNNAIPTKLVSSLSDWIDVAAEAKDNSLEITFDSIKPKPKDTKAAINNITVKRIPFISVSD